MNDVTNILLRIEQGDTLAGERLLPLVYDDAAGATGIVDGRLADASIR